MASDEQTGDEMRRGLEDKDELGKSMLRIWEEIFKLPTIGPLFSYFGNIKDENAQVANLTETIMKSQITIGHYWKQVNQAYVNAVLRINEKTASSLLDIKTKKDLDDYRKLMIDSFEEEFTKLFNSKEFALTYRELLGKQMDLLKQIQSSTERTLGILNLPTRRELDMMSKDLHDLRKLVMDMNEKLEAAISKMHS
jgi:Poly(R)-hydroxyalkanoic acid synthase subunit (PHA_synth_III_E)